jgi:hypothetical protein
MSERHPNQKRLQFETLERRETPAPIAGIAPLSAGAAAGVAPDASIPKGAVIRGQERVNYNPPVNLSTGTGVSLTGIATGSAAALGSFTGNVVNSIAFDFRSFSLKETIQAPNGNKIFAAIVGHYKHRTNTFSAKGGATTNAFFIDGGTGDFAGIKARGSASLSPIRPGPYPFRNATIAFNARVIS